MSSHAKKTRGRIGRHVLTVFAILLLVGSIGLFDVSIFDQMIAVTMSRNVTPPVQNDGAVSSLIQIVPQLPESNPVTSSPNSHVSAPPSSTPSSRTQTSSTPAVSAISQPPRSSTPVSTAPPMNPAVYQAMYPELYVENAEPLVPVSGKVVYLTFDDGPSNLTIPLLDVLDRYKVKATFFLVGKTDQADLSAMKAIVERGHAIGVHSYTHRLNQIYATPAAFLDDFARMHDLIQKTTGVDTHIYRYAGGSVNDYNRSTTAKAIITEMNRRGYTYFDWNVSSGDAERGSTAASIYNDTIQGVHAHTRSVILFHNTSVKGSTLGQMSRIIETLQKEGYRFETLNSSVDNRPYIFRVPK